MKNRDPILGGAVMPHPPIIVPGVSSEPPLAQKTISAMQTASAELMRLQPDTVVIISPHAPMFSDFLYIYGSNRLSGDLSRFSAGESSLSFTNDTELMQEYTARLDASGINGGSLDKSQMNQFNLNADLDHGVMVPLHFLNKPDYHFKLLALSSSYLELPRIYRAGTALAESARHLQRRIVIIASGDQSHKVNKESPYGSSTEGPIYDAAICDGLKRSDIKALLSIEPDLCEKAAECGYRSLFMMLGAFSLVSLKTRLLSYEAPYGIGYCVAMVEPEKTEAEQRTDILEQVIIKKRERSAKKQSDASFPVQIARQTIESLLLQGKMPEKTDLHRYREQAPELFSEKAGVFVSLKKWGALRGCIGTTTATTRSIADEIIQNAVSASQNDPRFDAVEASELHDLDISVDILGEAEPVHDSSQLDPDKYGVIVSNGMRSGLLLPALEGVNSVEQQLEIACQKAGIDPASNYQIQRFCVTRYN